MMIPESFKNRIIGAFGKEGEIWLETLETRVQTCVQKWKIEVEGPVSNLSYNYVLTARDSEGNPVILKLGVPNFDFQNEIRTVQLYAGKGCAPLLKADAEIGAMLLKELVPGTMLTEERNEKLSVQTYVKVWKDIRRPLPVNSAFPVIQDWAGGLDRYLDQYPNADAPIPQDAVQLAKECFAFIIETSRGSELLHGDLHHENILFSNEEGWMAIDPKGVAGDPYFDLVSFLINRLNNRKNPKETLEQRIWFLCEEAGFDRERLLKAAIAMAVLYACWGIEDQADWKNTYQCARWFQEFLQK